MRAAGVIIGTRGSALALWQAHHIKGELERIAPGLSVEIRIIKTQGDQIQDRPLAQVPGKGFFTKEIEDALIREEVDLAVHSLKDLPTENPDGLEVAAIPPRVSPHDALVTADGRPLVELPQGARVGTASLRRAAQLRHSRPDLEVLTLRGNVDTRLRKLAQGEFDAIVLAEAGLERLCPPGVRYWRLPSTLMMPAVGQGALGIQIRSSDSSTRTTVARLDHGPTRVCVEAERAFLAGLGGGCSAPVGALAILEGTQLTLNGVVGDPEGSALLAESCAGPDSTAIGLGQDLARTLLERGAARWIRPPARSPQ